MTSPRRRVIRNQPIVAENERALQRREARLEKERTACRRWVGKLKRALRAVDKSLSQISRLEKMISLLRQV